MELKFDTYYKKDIPFKATLEDLEHAIYLSDELLLAYIRNCGDRVRFLANTTSPSDCIQTPFGFALYGSKQVKSLCKMICDENSLYNPLGETDSIHKGGHWYHPYKIKFTSDEFQGKVELMYFSDFCSLVRDGYIEIWEMGE